MISDRGLKTLIEVDGGVKPDNARTVAGAGADILVMGSAFSVLKIYVALTRYVSCSDSKEKNMAFLLFCHSRGDAESSLFTGFLLSRE